MRFKTLSSKKTHTLVRQTSCSCAQKWNGFTICPSTCNIFQQISSFVCMCQHSSSTLFIQDRAKPSRCIVCKLCSVPLQLLLGMGREFSAVTVLHTLSFQLKHSKLLFRTRLQDSLRKVPRAEVPAALLVRWESRDTAPGSAGQSVKVAWREALGIQSLF